VVENVGVTFTPRSVVDDRWQEGFFSLVHTFFAIPGPFLFWKKLKTNLFSSGRGKPANQNPISSNMNDDGFTDLIAPTHQMEASVLAFKTKEYDLRPNRIIQSRIHLLVQEMPYLIHETCLCMAVGVLLLVGGAAVLAVQIGTKIVENSAEVLPEGTFNDSGTMVNGALLVIDAPEEKATSVPSVCLLDAQLSQGELL